MATNRNVICIPFPCIENAYVVISGYKVDTSNGVKKCMSFFFDNGDIGVEWEPDYGPITKISKLNEGDDGAIPHWFYPYYGGNGDWSQMAVNEEGLGLAFLDGDYKKLFAILKDWAR